MNKKEISIQINKLIKKEDWNSIIELANTELINSPNDHWLLTMIASAYYEKKAYKTAYKIITKALSIQNNCPLVLWHLGNILRMINKPEDAIIVWKEIIKRGEKNIAYDNCGEGSDWAKSLINDCRYRISKTYKEIGNINAYKVFKNNYLKKIKIGVATMYSPTEL